MAISQNPLIGKTKKSAGGVTFSSWKGRNVIKNKATQVANPQTAAQMAQRTRFAGVNKLYALIKVYVSIFILKTAKTITAANQFARWNLYLFETDSVGILPEKMDSLKFSEGSLYLNTPTSVEVITNSGFTATITPNMNPNYNFATTSVKVLCYNVDKNVWSEYAGTIGSGVFTVNTAGVGESGEIIKYWVIGYETTGMAQSNSYFMGDVELA